MCHKNGPYVLVVCTGLNSAFDDRPSTHRVAFRHVQTRTPVERVPRRPAAVQSQQCGRRRPSHKPNHAVVAPRARAFRATNSISSERRRPQPPLPPPSISLALWPPSQWLFISAPPRGADESAGDDCARGRPAPPASTAVIEKWRNGDARTPATALVPVSSRTHKRIWRRYRTTGRYTSDLPSAITQWICVQCSVERHPPTNFSCGHWSAHRYSFFHSFIRSLLRHTWNDSQVILSTTGLFSTMLRQCNVAKSPWLPTVVCEIERQSNCTVCE